MDLRVLVVEDCSSDAELILRQFTKAGFQVHGACVEEAREMTEALAREEWDVVIADYHLPCFSAPVRYRFCGRAGRTFRSSLFREASGKKSPSN